MDYMISSNRYRHFQIQCNRNRLHCKCNRNQRLLSRLHNICYVIWIYHARDIVWYVVREKLTIELINPLTDCCHSSRHDDLSGFFLFYEHERKICWNTASDVAGISITVHIKRHFRLTCCFHTVKPKIVTHPAIIHDFFLTPSF